MLVKESRLLCKGEQKESGLCSLLPKETLGAQIFVCVSLTDGGGGPGKGCSDILPT
jgi:hypothetical protein